MDRATLEKMHVDAQENLQKLLGIVAELEATLKTRTAQVQQWQGRELTLRELLDSPEEAGEPGA